MKRILFWAILAICYLIGIYQVSVVLGVAGAVVAVLLAPLTVILALASRPLIGIVLAIFLTYLYTKLE